MILRVCDQSHINPNRSMMTPLYIDPESRNGQHLLCRTEFHGQAECLTSVVIAHRTKGADMDIPQSKLIYGKLGTAIAITRLCSKAFPGSTDGSLSSITYVEESIHKRLHLLQGQLTRNVQHVAGLNPKAFRYVITECCSIESNIGSWMMPALCGTTSYRDLYQRESWTATFWLDMKICPLAVKTRLLAKLELTESAF